MSKEKLIKLFLFYILLTAITIVIGACASARSEAPDLSGEFAATPAFVQEAAVEQEFAESEEAIFSDSVDDTNFKNADRIVIKNADLSIVVDDPSKSLDIITQMAEEMGGFTVTANLYQRELDSGIVVTQAVITIRIPAERLNEALNLIKNQSDQDPLNESINSQDVTREYTDLQSRLRNLENAESQLLKILEGAEETEDVLAVYNELVRVQEQIEVIKGQINYFEQSAALSAVSVELIADEAVQPLTIGGWQPGGVAKDAVQTLINSLKFLVNALIWIVIYVLPILVVIVILVAIPVYIIRWMIRRTRSRKKETTRAQEKED